MQLRKTMEELKGRDFEININHIGKGGGGEDTWQSAPREQLSAVTWVTKPHR